MEDDSAGDDANPYQVSAVQRRWNTRSSTNRISEGTIVIYNTRKGGGKKEKKPGMSSAEIDAMCLEHINRMVSKRNTDDFLTALMACFKSKKATVFEKEISPILFTLMQVDLCIFNLVQNRLNKASACIDNSGVPLNWEIPKNPGISKDLLPLVEKTQEHIMKEWDSRRERICKENRMELEIDATDDDTHTRPFDVVFMPPPPSRDEFVKLTAFTRTCFYLVWMSMKDAKDVDRRPDVMKIIIEQLRHITSPSLFLHEVKRIVARNLIAWMESVGETNHPQYAWHKQVSESEVPIKKKRRRKRKATGGAGGRNGAKRKTTKAKRPRRSRRKAEDSDSDFDEKLLEDDDDDGEEESSSEHEDEEEEEVSTTKASKAESTSGRSEGSKEESTVDESTEATGREITQETGQEINQETGREINQETGLEVKPEMSQKPEKWIGTFQHWRVDDEDDEKRCDIGTRNLSQEFDQETIDRSQETPERKQKLAAASGLPQEVQDMIDFVEKNADVVTKILLGMWKEECTKNNNPKLFYFAIGGVYHALSGKQLTDVWMYHHDPIAKDRNHSDYLPPKPSKGDPGKGTKAGVSYAKPGAGFVRAHRDCLHLLHVFLVGLAPVGLAPVRLYWKEVLNEKLKKFGDITQDDYEFACVAALILASATNDDECIEGIVSLRRAGLLSAKALKEAPLDVISQHIKTSGRQHQNAKYLKDLGTMVMDEFDGKVPRSLDDLIRIAGIHEKAGNCAGEAFGVFGKIDGIATDRHVRDVSLALKNLILPDWLVGKSVVHTQMSLRTWVPVFDYTIVNPVMGGMAQLFTQTFQTLSEKDTEVDDLGRTKMARAEILIQSLADHIWKPYHVEVVWFAIAAIRWYYLDPNSPRQKKKKASGSPAETGETPVDNKAAKQERKTETNQETSKESSQETKRKGTESKETKEDYESTETKEDYDTEMTKMKKAVAESELETERMKKKMEEMVGIVG